MKFKIILLIVFVSIYTSSYSQKNSFLNKLKNKVLSEKLSNKEKAEIYNKIAHSYSDSVQDKKTAIKYYLQAIKYGKKDNNKELISNSSNKLGVCYEIIGNHDSSLLYFNRFLNYSIELKDSTGIGDAYNNMGMVYEFSGNYEKAINNYIKSSAIKDQLPDTNRIIASYLSIGAIYRHMNKFDKASEYINDALKLNKRNNDNVMYARIYNELAMISKHYNKLDSAISYYNKTLEYSKKINWKKGIATALSNIANVYTIEEKYNKALDYHKKSLKIEEELKHNYGIMLSKNSLAEVLQLLGQNSQAEKYLKESLLMAKKENNATIIADNYMILYNIYSGKKNYKTALKYFEIYSNYKDSLYDVETTDRIARLETKYQTEKKEQRIKFLDDKNRLKEEKLKKQAQFIRLVVGALIVFVLMCIILVVLYLQRRKAHKDLVRQNLKAIEQENQLIKTISDKKTTEKSSLHNEQRTQDLLNNLIVYLEEEKFYLKPNFTIEILAKELGSNRQYISKLINERFGKNFSSFINEYRIKEARRLLADSKNDKYTIEGIAKTVGFNSRTSFISSFKKYTGVTPSFFKNNYQNI